MKTDVLAGILDDCVKVGASSIISSSDYLALFGVKETLTARDLLKHVLTILAKYHPPFEKWSPELATILLEGSLSERITRSLGNDASGERIAAVYKSLANCLAHNKMFLP